MSLLQLLIRSYDLCDKDFYSDTCNVKRKMIDQGVQTDPRPKLVPWENSCKYYITQMHATKECRRWNILKADK